MMNENIEDLFICGKCRRHFTDLHFFLSHRLTCRATRVDGTSTEANLSVGDLDPMLDETSSTSDLIPTHPSNEFDLLFSSPVDQMVLNSDLLSSNVKSSSGIAVECPVCDKHFEDGQILENHLFEHSTCLDDLQVNQSNRKSPLECQTCTISFTSNASLSLHKKLTHCLRPVFRCLNSQCSQLFDKPVDYILHARIHSQKHNKSRRRKATHRCRICKRVFLSFEQLQIHINKDEHEFSCQLCSAIFRSNNAYHNHLAHHQERIPVYRCYLCEESFQKRTDLSKHISIKHQDDFPKQKTCSMCKLTFKTTFHLNRHNITKHSDVKPYKCEQEGCQQAFARKDKLKQHAAKHTPTGGMFKCEICVKTFVRAEHLRDHDIVRHSHQFPFRCEYCRKGFLHPNQLYSHHKQHHPKESDESPVDSTGL